jgi:hypothetical protein
MIIKFAMKTPNGERYERTLNKNEKEKFTRFAWEHKISIRDYYYISYDYFNYVCAETGINP